MADLLPQLLVVIIAIASVAVFARYSIKDSYFTAAHEMGHAVAVKHYGGTVDRVVLSPHGRSGYTTFDPIENHKYELRVMVAGYVAEEIARGRQPGKMLKGGQYEGDLTLIRDIVGRNDTEVEMAISVVTKLISRPDVQSYIKDQSVALVNKGELAGSSIKVFK